MILTTGHLKPLRSQIDEARVTADGSFCRLSSASFMDNVPSFEGWANGDVSYTLLKLRNVEPHNNVRVG